MRGLLYRSNFVPGVRHVLGWRGLKDCSTCVGGWTVKIATYAGIFALYFQSTEARSEWIRGRFGIVYFPDTEEDLIAEVSIEGFLRARSFTYLPHIREFLLHPKLVDLFVIGELSLVVNIDETFLLLALESMNRQRSIALDGIRLPKEDEIIPLVEPGGYDQDFPAYTVASGFWKVIAASLAFSLEEPPSYLHHHQIPGSVIAYDSAGRHREKAQEGISRHYLYLGFGHADFSALLKNLHQELEGQKDSVEWRLGEPLPLEYADETWWQAHRIRDFKTLDKQGLGIDERPQLIILTGFLGAGKTSFLQYFIEHQMQLSRFVAVIQNEIGETGLDGKLLNDDYSVTEIDEGCVCCTLVGNLRKALNQILSQFQPDTIVLETTGLANPFNLMDELVEIEELVRFDSLTTVVDCANFMESLAAYGVASEQIRAADIILLNKVDLVKACALDEIRKKIRALNPRAVTLTSTWGHIPPAVLYGTDPLEGHGGKGLSENASGKEHPHLTHVQDGLSSHKIGLEGPLELKWLMDVFAHSIPSNIFRIKGIVDFKHSKKPKVVQYVAGRYELSEFTNLNVMERFLIFIGQDLDRKELQRLFDNLGEKPKEQLRPSGQCCTYKGTRERERG